MLDLSPEKIMVLMAIGLVVLGPQRLPSAARTLAHGFARARRLAETLTQPMNEALAEPRGQVESVMAEVREAIHAPVRTMTSTGAAPAPSPTEALPSPTEALPSPAEAAPYATEAVPFTAEAVPFATEHPGAGGAGGDRVGDHFDPALN
ncbi:MAG TPA: twin-arginine translocase TatA/TatE family subunit [Acidimicrobiales bacterium]|nr:twin-arginine translocase TatA/TatE family subunit [Acidimicrobiales bacterium]